MLILSNKSAINSAKILSNSLNDLGIETSVITEPTKVKEDGFIRYGNGRKTWYKERFNSPEFIRLSGNKLLFSISMKENNIYSPIFYKENAELIFPMLIRETLYGQGSKGIIPIRNIDEFDENWNNNYYWTPFINLKFELRVHVFNHTILKVFKKQDLPDKINSEFPIRNNDTCHYFWKSSDRYPKLQELVNKLKEINPINTSVFYAMDIGWNPNKKEYFLIELNSCPGLNPNTAKMYAEKIKDIL